MTLYYYYTMDPSLKQKLDAYEKSLTEQEKKAMEMKAQKSINYQIETQKEQEKQKENQQSKNQIEL